MQFNTRKSFSITVVMGILALVIGTLGIPQSSAQSTNFSLIATSQNQFAFDFYQQIRDDNSDNLIFSAYSIWQAFAMVYAGARGNTESQMASVMHYDLSQAELHAAIAALNADIASRGVRPEEITEQDADVQPLQLNIANGLWGQINIPFYQSYLDILLQQYQSEMFYADFAEGSLEAIREEINNWIELQTQDKIVDLIPEDLLEEETMMVLANAIYFKGSWFTPFLEIDTQDAPFYILNGDEAMVPMMFQNGNFRYATTNEFEVVELPYFGGTASMMLILPANGSFEIVEQTFDLNMFDAIRTQLDSNLIHANLYVPRFEFETSIGLKDILENMGMVDAFDRYESDFTGILSLDIARLYILEALHKAYIKIDETGTEAAAATAIIVNGIISVPPTLPPPIEIRFDHPFLYAIYDKPTGTILFMGRIVNPAEG